MPEAQNNPTEIGVITGLTGEAFAESASGLRALEPGSPIYQGEELVTESGGNVEVRFIDDTLLSQGENSRIALDDYVFDPDDSSNSELMLDIAQGTFRVVTGKIAENNPERFKIGSPLATMGIRGTITIHEVGPDGEKHGVEEIHSGKALTVQSNITGAIRQIGQPMGLVDVTRSGALSQVRPLSQQEFNTFRKIAPENIRHELEIRNEREDQDRRDDDDDQNDEQQDGGQPEGQQDELPADVAPGGGDPAEEGEDPGSVLYAKGGVVEPGKETLADQKELDGSKMKQPPKPGEKPEPEDQEKRNEGKPEPDKEDDQEQEQKDESEKNEHDEPKKQEQPKPKEDESDLEDDQKQAKDQTENEQDDSGTSSESGDDDDNHAEGIVGKAGQTNNLKGTAEADNMVGREMSDTLSGLGGDDSLYGNEGNDTLLGGTGDDYLDGGAGDKDFASYAGAESGVTATLTGSGNGTATGTEIGNDTLLNIEGLIGSNHTDTLIGDDGNNSFRLLLNREFDPHSVVNNEYVDGGAGSDWLLFDDLSEGVSVSLFSNHVAVGNIEAPSNVVEAANIENILGTVQDDTILGSSEKNTLLSGNGDDLLSGMDNCNSIDGGAGNDTLTYSDSNDVVTIVLDAVGKGTATHHTSESIDTFENIEIIEGSTHNDHFTGSSGSDTFDGNAGNDTIEAGGGDDYLVGRAGNDTLDGEDGNDWVSYSYSNTGVTMTLSTGTDGTATIGAENDTLKHIENAEGSIVGDKIYGSEGNNILKGLDGNDTLKGGLGDDTIFGGSGSDFLEGGGGNDTVSFADLIGGTGVEIDIAAGKVKHSSGTDTLNDSFDTFVGSDAGDTYTGNGGSDIFDGGKGADLFNVTTGGNSFDGGAGKDTVSFANLSSGVTVSVDGGNATIVDGIMNFTNVENFIGTAESDKFTGSNANETFSGGGGLDTIDGGGGSDWISYAYDTTHDGLTLKLASGEEYGDLGGIIDKVISIENAIGTDGVDTIIGSDANNILIGGKDGDFLKGGDGNDTLIGGEGNDLLDGEGGSADAISYEGSETGITVDLGNGTGNVTHGADTDNFLNIEAIIGSNVADTITSSCSFNDTIQGGGGQDKITLMSGKETTLKYTALSDGGDTITNFIHGEDKLYFSGNDFDSSAGDNLVTMSGTYDGTTGPANSDACFIFDDTSGKLWYDSNGNEAGGEELMATLSGVTDLSDSDISVA